MKFFKAFQGLTLGMLLWSVFILFAAPVVGHEIGVWLFNVPTDYDVSIYWAPHN